MKKQFQSINTYYSTAVKLIPLVLYRLRMSPGRDTVSGLRYTLHRLFWSSAKRSEQKHFELCVLIGQACWVRLFGSACLKPVDFPESCG